MRLLAALREAGTTILLVEQNARMALRARGPGLRARDGQRGAGRLGDADLLDNDQLKAAYLGG